MNNFAIHLILAILSHCEINNCDFKDLLNYMTNLKQVTLCQMDQAFVRDFLPKLNIQQLESLHLLETSHRTQQYCVMNSLLELAPQFQNLKELTLSLSSAFIWDQVVPFLLNLPSKNLQLLTINFLFLSLHLSDLLELPFYRFKETKFYLRDLYIDCLIPGLVGEYFTNPINNPTIPNSMHLLFTHLPDFNPNFLATQTRMRRFTCIEYENKIDQLQKFLLAGAKFTILDVDKGTKIKIFPMDYKLGDQTFQSVPLGAITYIYDRLDLNKKLEKRFPRISSEVNMNEE